MSIALVSITDGRGDCLDRTLASARTHLHGPITHRLMIDDSADPDYGDRIDRIYGASWDIVHHRRRYGFAGAIQSAWAQLQPRHEPWVFHLEDDFEFTRHVDLVEMAHALTDHPHLVQMALRRQAVSAVEAAAGGVVEMWPGAYTDVHHGTAHWLEHRLFFTTNPALYRRALTTAGWPTGAGSEHAFTQRLLANDTVRFGYWGRRTDKPWVHHLGDQRVGTGY